MTPNQFAYSYKHLVIVHGIGEQVPNETSLNFMNNFLRALPSGDGYDLKVDNLIGSLRTPQHKITVERFDPSFAVFTDIAQNRKTIIGFSEVYWQDITGQILKMYDDAPPVPIFVWAHSINTRLIREGHTFYMVRDAITNLEGILGIVRTLAAIHKKSAVFLSIVNHFLGDVQMYTENEEIRGQIDQRFNQVLARIPEQCAKAVTRLKLDVADVGKPEIYVVAHSEGTVVTYASLVDAAQAQQPWFDRVKGLVTLGSPIDKHYTIWNSCFELHRYSGAQRSEKIRWFNYWDISDPVGYGLKVLQPDPAPDPRQDTDAAKLFTVCYDRGFARYPVPGLAHVEYWDDFGIYENILDKVMDIVTTRSSTLVESKWFGRNKYIQPAGAWLSYFVLRAATVGAILYFTSRLLSWLPISHPLAFMDNSPTPWRYLNESLWLAAPLLLDKVMWEVFARNTGLLAKSASLLRWVLGALFVGVLFGVAWNHSIGGDMPSVEDTLGYTTGLAVSILGWRLHTKLHKGLFQMWKYTRGWNQSGDDGTNARENREAYRAPAVSKRAATS